VTPNQFNMKETTADNNRYLIIGFLLHYPYHRIL
jgi:hypothetical protein